MKRLPLLRCLILPQVTLHKELHCVKSVRIRSFSGPYFPAFGLNTERYSVSLCIQSKCGKMRTGKNPNKDTFHAVLLGYFIPVPLECCL